MPFLGAEQTTSSLVVTDCRKRTSESWAFCCKSVKIKEGGKNAENKSKRKRTAGSFFNRRICAAGAFAKKDRFSGRLYAYL